MQVQVANYRLYLLHLAGLVTMGCDQFINGDSEPCEPTPNYPTVISVLSDDQYLGLKAEFDSLNKNRFWCTTIDSFGFVTDASGCSRPIGLISEEEATRFASNVEATLVEFGTFTKIYDAALLKVTSNSWRDDNTSAFWIRFGAQTMAGLKVKNSEISVMIYADGSLRMNGRWYDQITLPNCDMVTKDEVISAVLDTTVQYRGIAGNLNVFQVVEERIGSFNKMILPVNNGDTITLHVVWRVGYYRDWWYIYVDTTTGRILHIQTNIIG